MTLQDHSDTELYQIICDGRRHAEDAFKELYRRHSPRIYRYCHKILGHREEAEDVFQETFVKFYTSAANYRNSMTNVPAFLFRIARNLSLNRKRNQIYLESLDGLEIGYSPDFGFEREELLALIARAVETLDFDYREAFVLREYEDMPYDQIAELIGSTINTVRSRVFRARQQIRRILSLQIKELG